MSFGPTSKEDALKWIQEAMVAPRYTPSSHLFDRSDERRLDMNDVLNAVEFATSCLPYTNGPPRHGGTCWRVIGPTIDDGQPIAVGFEAYVDKKRRWCVVCTVFRK